MALPPVKMHKLPFPVVTREAQKFWASKHICNRVKAVISFSRNREEALRLMRIYVPGKPHHFRERAWNAWKLYVGLHEMDKIPYSEMEDKWWDCIPRGTAPGPSGFWTLWDDSEQWDDPEKWNEWTQTTKEATNAPDFLEGNQRSSD